MSIRAFVILFLGLFHFSSFSYAGEAKEMRLYCSSIFIEVSSQSRFHDQRKANLQRSYAYLKDFYQWQVENRQELLQTLKTENVGPYGLLFKQKLVQTEKKLAKLLTEIENKPNEFYTITLTNEKQIREFKQKLQRDSERDFSHNNVGPGVFELLSGKGVYRRSDILRPNPIFLAEHFLVPLSPSTVDYLFKPDFVFNAELSEEDIEIDIFFAQMYSLERTLIKLSLYRDGMSKKDFQYHYGFKLRDLYVFERSSASGAEAFLSIVIRAKLGDTNTPSKQRQKASKKDVLGILPAAT